MTERPPYWIWWVTLCTGAVCIGVGLMSWLTPQVLFGSEGYRTVARGAIGTLGALVFALGINLVWSWLRSSVSAAREHLRTLIIALSAAPAIALFNLGALEPLRQATGINVFVFIGGVLVVLLFPACLAFFATGSSADVPRETAVSGPDDRSCLSGAVE